EYVTVKPGTACAANYAQDSLKGSSVENSGGTVLGPTTVTAKWTVGTTNDQGRPTGPYVVCAYVQKDPDSPVPPATATAVIQVSAAASGGPAGGGKTTCPAVRKAQRSVATYLASYKADTRKAHKAHGKTRTRYLKLATTAHKKYLAAKRT